MKSKLTKDEAIEQATLEAAVQADERKETPVKDTPAKETPEPVPPVETAPDPRERWLEEARSSLAILGAGQVVSSGVMTRLVAEAVGLLSPPA